jgi:hypothetical protein
MRDCSSGARFDLFFNLTFVDIAGGRKRDKPDNSYRREMSYQQLMNDPDFTRAFKSIAEACIIDVEIAKW